jgi:hypothetical protein
VAGELAEGTRSASAPGGFLLVTFLQLLEDKFIGNVVCCAADPQGKSHGRDLQRNSLQQGRNYCLITRDNKIELIKRVLEEILSATPLSEY